MASVAIRRGRTAYNVRQPEDTTTPEGSPSYDPTPSPDPSPAPTVSPQPAPAMPSGMAAINALNPGGENRDLPYVQGGNTGGWLEGVGETLGAGTSMTAAARDQYLAQARAGGVSDDYINWFMGQGGPGGGTDYHRILSTWNQEYGPNAGSGSGGGSNTQSRSNTSVGHGDAQFTDPIASFLEAAARGRVDRLENPPADSGQALLEKMLRDVAQQFQSGGYTNAEQEIFQTRAMEPLEQLRTARKQQVLQQLSQRGIDPSSGVGRSMLMDVDRQFDTMRATTQRDLASTEAQERTNRILQALGLSGQLASTEEGRLDKAFQYRTVPLNLADRSFSQAMQLYGSNNPLSLVNPLLQLSQNQQSRSNAGQAGLADLIYALLNMGN